MEVKENLRREIYNFKIKVPTELGSEPIKELAEKIRELDRQLREATIEKNIEKVKELNLLLFHQFKIGVNFLRQEVERGVPLLYNLVVFGIQFPYSSRGRSRGRGDKWV